MTTNPVADTGWLSFDVHGRARMGVTVGSGGRSINSQDPTLAWAPYFQAYMGSNNNATYGFLKVDVSDSQLSAQFVRGSGGSYTDAFSLTKPLATSSPSPTATASSSPSPTSSSTVQASVRSSATYAGTASESSSTVPMPAGWKPG